MVAYFWILILILQWHIFWIHIFHSIYMTNIVSLFQKFIMNYFLKRIYPYLKIWFQLNSINSEYWCFHYKLNYYIPFYEINNQAQVPMYWKKRNNI
jgi:hypothetical protein